MCNRIAWWVHPAALGSCLYVSSCNRILVGKGRPAMGSYEGCIKLQQDPIREASSCNRILLGMDPAAIGSY